MAFTAVRNCSQCVAFATVPTVRGVSTNTTVVAASTALNAPGPPPVTARTLYKYVVFADTVLSLNEVPAVVTSGANALLLKLRCTS